MVRWIRPCCSFLVIVSTCPGPHRLWFLLIKVQTLPCLVTTSLWRVVTTLAQWHNDQTQMMSFPAPGAAALSLMVNSAADAISNMTQVSLDLIPLSVTSWWTSQKISLKLTLDVSQRLKIHADELLVDARNSSAAFLTLFITFQDSQRSVVRRRGRHSSVLARKTKWLPAFVTGGCWGRSKHDLWLLWG